MNVRTALRVNRRFDALPAPAAPLSSRDLANLANTLRAKTFPDAVPSSRLRFGRLARGVHRAKLRYQDNIVHCEPCRTVAATPTAPW